MRGYSGRKQCICMLLEGEGHAARRVIAVGGCHKGRSGTGQSRAEQSRAGQKRRDWIEFTTHGFGLAIHV